MSGLVETAFRDVAHLYRTSHLQLLKKIFYDPESSENDKYVALEMMKNAVISSDFVFPMCQDTGTAIVMGKKGQHVFTGFSDEEAISKGVFNAYTKNNLRYSQMAPLECMMKKIPGAIFLPRLSCMQWKETHTVFFLLQKAADQPTRHIYFRKQGRFLNPGVLSDYLDG